jgi:hypothetical protein
MIIIGREMNLRQPISQTHNQSHLLVRHLDIEIVIQISPFVMSVSTQGGKIGMINAGDTAVFQHNRDREKAPHIFAANDFNDISDKFLKGLTGVGMDKVRLGAALFNPHVNQYVIGSPTAMCGSIPLILLRNAAETSGIAWSNPSETSVDTSEERHRAMALLLSERGSVDFSFS